MNYFSFELKKIMHFNFFFNLIFLFFFFLCLSQHFLCLVSLKPVCTFLRPGIISLKPGIKAWLYISPSLVENQPPYLSIFFLKISNCSLFLFLTTNQNIFWILNAIYLDTYAIRRLRTLLFCPRAEWGQRREK